VVGKVVGNMPPDQFSVLADEEVAASSPIGFLVRDLAASPFRVAPERAYELNRLVHEYGMEILYHPDREDTRLEVSSPAVISFGLPFAERVWLSATLTRN